MASVSASVTGVPAIGEDNIGDGWDAFSVSGPELRTVVCCLLFVVVVVVCY